MIRRGIKKVPPAVQVKPFDFLTCTLTSEQTATEDTIILDKAVCSLLLHPVPP